MNCEEIETTLLFLEYNAMNNSVLCVCVCVRYSTTKASALASIVFILDKFGYFEVEHSLVYLGVCVFFLFFRFLALFVGPHDIFVPFENLFCALFMGGIWDAIQRVITRERKAEDGAVKPGSAAKSPEEKKKD